LLLLHDVLGVAASQGQAGSIIEIGALRALALAARSNQRIAHDLVVALDTVKKHVTHILGKLGAANRTEAADPGPPAGPDPLTPHPSRPGNTFG